MQKLVIWQTTCHNNLTRGIKNKTKKKKHKNKRIYLRIRGRKIGKNLLDYALDGDQRVNRRFEAADIGDATWSSRGK